MRPVPPPPSDAAPPAAAVASSRLRHFSATKSANNETQLDRLFEVAPATTTSTPSRPSFALAAEGSPLSCNRDQSIGTVEDPEEKDEFTFSSSTGSVCSQLQTNVEIAPSAAARETGPFDSTPPPAAFDESTKQKCRSFRLSHNLFAGAVDALPHFVRHEQDHRQPVATNMPEFGSARVAAAAKVSPGAAASRRVRFLKDDHVLEPEPICAGSLTLSLISIHDSGGSTMP